MIATLVRPTLSMDSTAGKLSVTPPPIAKTTEEIRADIEKAVSDGRITKEQIFERLAPEQLRKLYPAENKRNDLEKQRIDFENAISAGGITKEQIFDLLSPEQLYELYPNLPVTLGNLAIGQSADAKQRIAEADEAFPKLQLAQADAQQRRIELMQTQLEQATQKAGRG